MTNPVIKQSWREVEWGERSAGYSLHLNNKDKNDFISSYKKISKSSKCYCYPGNSTVIDVDDNLYELIQFNSPGVKTYSGEQYLRLKKDRLDLIIANDKILEEYANDFRHEVNRELFIKKYLNINDNEKVKKHKKPKKTYFNFMLNKKFSSLRSSNYSKSNKKTFVEVMEKLEGGNFYLYLADKIAKDMHNQQCRKDGKTPYVVHPRAVKKLILEYGVDSLDAQIASLLHDVPEDTVVNEKKALENIKSIFGEKVYNYVSTLTKGLDKQEYQDRFWNASYEVQMIKLCDVLHNMKTLNINKDKFPETIPNMIKKCNDTYIPLAKEIQPDIANKLETLVWLYK